MKNCRKPKERREHTFFEGGESVEVLVVHPYAYH